MIIKKKNQGFTLIEILISIAIFGFLIYIISAILIVILQTVNVINQRAYLRNNLETTISVITDDIQFANNLAPCDATQNIPGTSYKPVLANSCITMSVPTTNVTGTTIETEYLYYDTNLSTIVKDVNINGNSPDIKYLTATNVKVTGTVFTIEQGNVLFSAAAEVDSTVNSVTKPVVQLALSNVIQYNK